MMHLQIYFWNSYSFYLTSLYKFAIIFIKNYCYIGGIIYSWNVDGVYYGGVDIVWRERAQGEMARTVRYLGWWCEKLVL